MLSTSSLKGWIMLVVDDDLKSLRMMEILLSSYGVVVVKAENGQEGLAMAKECQPKIIITDLSMPVMNGWDMVAALKQDPTLADIPVIALTAHAMNGDREKAISAGCHDYITKPIMPMNFFTQLISILLEIPEFAPLLE